MGWRWRSYPLIDEGDEPDAFAPRTRDAVDVASVDPLVKNAEASSSSIVRYSWDNGEKFAGGFGDTQLLRTDYWTLRARSAQLFETNLYARGLIRRLVTNIINTGLFPEAAPEEKILGLREQSLMDWSEEVETRFSLWGSDPWLCHHGEQLTLGMIQAMALMEALIVGDVLVTLLQFSATSLPRIQLINGARVRTPMDATPRTQGGKICEGVELDAQGRQIAYWVTQDDGSSKRLPAWGEKSGRRLAWLFYGTPDNRCDTVRGKPMLSLILQSLREIDRYRDAALRKAVVNSMLAGFIKKSAPVAGSLPITGGGGAVRIGSETLGSAPSSEAREFTFAEMLPGVYLQELKVGEEPQAMSANGTDEKFGVFEDAMVSAIAWTHQVPPEILKLSFGTNYAASQAAINEFKMFLNKERTRVGDTLCQPIYTEWLLAVVLSGKISAPGLVDSWRDSKQYDAFAAWTAADWAGAIKPAVDLTKLVGGYEKLLSIGAITRARATRELTGMKYSKVLKVREREDAELARVLAPMNAVNGVTPGATNADPALSEDGISQEDAPQNDGAKDPSNVADS